MPRDIQDAVTDAAATPTLPPDPDDLWRRGRRRRTFKTAAAAAAVVLVAAVAAAQTFVPGTADVFVDDGQPAAELTSPTGFEQVTDAHLTDPLPFDTPWDDARGLVAWSCNGADLSEVELRIVGMTPGTQVWWELERPYARPGDDTTSQHPPVHELGVEELRIDVNDRPDIRTSATVGQPSGQGRWVAADGTFTGQVQLDEPLGELTLMLVSDPPYEVTGSQTAVAMQVWMSDQRGFRCPAS